MIKFNVLCLFIILLSLIGCSPGIQTKPAVSDIKDTALNKEIIKWRPYINDKYGFSFEYPDTWVINGREYLSAGADGEIMSVMFILVDTITESSFFLNYHLEPYGKQLFEESLSDYNSGVNMYAKEKYIMKIAGSDAIVSVDSFYIERSREMDINHIPVHFTSIKFLDKNGTGEIDLKIKIPVSIYDKEVIKYNELLSTFKFLN